MERLGGGLAQRFGLDMDRGYATESILPYAFGWEAENGALSCMLGRCAGWRPVLPVVRRHARHGIRLFGDGDAHVRPDRDGLG
jgi:hypothetical protein